MKYLNRFHTTTKCDMLSAQKWLGQAYWHLTGAKKLAWPNSFHRL